MKKGIVIALVGALLAAGIAALYRWDGSSGAGLYPIVSISPDDRYIAYSYNRAIFIAKTDGTEIKQLTSPRADGHIGPVFSPDGSKILFVSYPRKAQKPLNHIYVMNADGSDLRRVTFEEGYILEAIFSADGAKIYFLRSGFYGNYSFVGRPGPHEVDAFSINADGTGRKNLTNYKAYGMSDLDVSSDGKILYLTLDDGPGNTLRAVSLDDTNQMPRVALGEQQGWEYRVSPDNKFVASIAVSEKPLYTGRGYEYELFLVDMESKRRTQLTFLGSYVSKPKFFHHQRRILFAHALNWPSQRPEYELMSVHLDGTHLEKINLTPPAASPQSQ